nr:M23 family metallopeptidase [Arthrobacter sp. 35W]
MTRSQPLPICFHPRTRARPLAAAFALALLLALVLPAPGDPSAGAAPPPPWTWPLVPRPAVVHPFAPPPKPWLAGHRGVDLAAAQGVPVTAPADGVVVFSGQVVDRDVVTIRHANGLLSSFEPVTGAPAAGTGVAQGQTVGILDGPTHCGSMMASPHSCLHWGVRRGEEYLDPLQFVQDRRPSILLPLTPRPN